MPPKLPSPLPVNLEGNVKLGVKTLIALLFAVVTGTITLVSVLPTKSDLRELFQKHDSSLDSHPKMTKTLKSVQSTDSRLKQLEASQEDNKDNFRYIRARIDFLTEQEIREKAPNRWAGRQAVKKLRSGAEPADVVSDE